MSSCQQTMSTYTVLNLWIEPNWIYLVPLEMTNFMWTRLEFPETSKTQLYFRHFWTKKKLNYFIEAYQKPAPDILHDRYSKTGFGLYHKRILYVWAFLIVRGIFAWGFDVKLILSTRIWFWRIDDFLFLKLDDCGLIDIRRKIISTFDVYATNNEFVALFSRIRDFHIQDERAIVSWRKPLIWTDWS